MVQVDPAGILLTLVVSSVAPEYEADQLMEIGLGLTIRDVCLFNPRLRLIIRRPGERGQGAGRCSAASHSWRNE
jgi:hypothetical protein